MTADRKGDDNLHLSCRGREGGGKRGREVRKEIDGKEGRDGWDGWGGDGTGRNIWR